MDSLGDMTGVAKPVEELGLKVFVSLDVIHLVDKSRLLHVDTIIANSLAGTEKLCDLDYLRDSIPTILLSPPLSPRCMSHLNLKWCLNNSVSAQLTMPCNHKDLADTLVTALESVTSHQAIAKDNMVNQKVAVKLLENYGNYMRIVENGQSAVDAVKECWHQGKPYHVILRALLY
ncbi:histidine kinase osmosensor [Tulasnella sp. 425]|nr:histidine kinase osmosensor [Tulasnella sp. 425]